MGVPIAIIIPSYRREEQTSITLKKLYGSRGWNDIFVPQVIVTDASVSPKLKEIVASFDNPKPLYVCPDNDGIARNKNFGAKHATSEIIYFCDSDMEVESDTILNSLIYLKDNVMLSMVGGEVIWKGGEQNGKLDRPREEDRIVEYENVSYVEALYSRFIATYRSIFWSVGGFNEDIFNMRGEGSDLSIRFWRSGYPLGFSKKIKVHHVYDAGEAVTRKVNHPEYGIIRDLIQLSYIYGISKNDSPNFANTLGWLSEEFGEFDKYVILEAVVNLLPQLWENKEKLIASKKNIRTIYDFKFLDVFTNRKLFLECIESANTRIKQSFEKAFT